MTRTKWFLHGDQILEVRDLRVLGQGHDLLDEAMDRAMADVQAGRFALAEGACA